MRREGITQRKAYDAIDKDLLHNCQIEWEPISTYWMSIQRTSRLVMLSNMELDEDMYL